jgi:hypothetical protein
VEVAFILNPVTKEFAFICSYSLLYHILIKFLFVVFELRTFEVRRCRVQQSRANNHVRFFLFYNKFGSARCTVNEKEIVHLSLSL